MTDDKKTAGIAITSLVLGIMSLPLMLLPALSVLLAIPAVICGHIGRSRIKKSAGALTGNGLALAGLITGYIGLLLAVAFISLMVFAAFSDTVRSKLTGTP